MLFTDLFESFDNDSSNLQLGDEVLVTYPNQFRGKRGEITGFGRDKAFVIVEINGREYSMHSSDVERLGGSEDWDNDDDYGTFGDDERDELDEYKGAHDKVTFEVDSENAYNHIMQKYGNVIDWAGDYMTVPARYWPAVQELAFAAGGDVQEIGIEEGVMKNIKRGLQGWYADDTDINGEKTGPKELVRRNKGYNDETLAMLHKSVAGEKKTKHSPGALQQRVLDREMKKRGLGEDGGSYYYEILAKKVFDENPNLSTKGRADDLFKAGWKYAVQDLGKARAQWEFGYDEDFPSDFVSAYGHLQRGGDLEEGWRQNLAALGTAAALGAGGMAAFGGNSSTAPTSSGPELVNPQQVVQMIKAGKINNQQDLLSVIGKAKNKSTVWKMLQSQAGMEGSSDADAVVQTIAGVREGVAEGAVNEGLDTDQLAGMIAARLERLAPNVFTDYGVEYVLDAVRDVAEFYAMSDFEELGTSDLGAMARSVVKQLKQREAHMNRGV